MRFRKNFARGVRRTPGEMNGLERQYADVLRVRQQAGEIDWWEFDAIKLRLAENTFYTPDFFIMRSDGGLEVHEVKGSSKGKPFVEDDAAVKIKVAASKYPFPFRMVWRVAGQWLEKVYE